MSYTYLLHYIGQGLYKRREFENEAVRLGVNRAFPRSTLKRLKWGSQILLATYDKKTKSAEVFGYYDVEGVNLSGCDETKQKVFEKIQVEEKMDLGPGGKHISRKCGSYTVTAVYYVKDTVAEISQKIKEAKEETKRHVKVFIFGSYHKFSKPRIFKDISFTRSGVFIETDKRVRNCKTKGGHVQFIRDYNQKRHRYKREDKNKSLFDGDQWRPE
jgi:hypothetical protein